MPGPVEGGLGRRVHAALRELSPGYFAAAMATGILSIGFGAEGFETLSDILLDLTVVAFLVLLGLTLWRLLAHRGDLVEDFTHLHRGFGFYSFVAAADVLAARIAASHQVLAAVLLAVAGVSWLARGYAVPWTTRLGRGEHPIVAAANGSWFMWAVGGQSVAVAAAVLAPAYPGPFLPMVAVVAWALGLFVYVVDGIFVVMRLLAYPFTAADLTPPYWVAMGAAAISVLAGAHITGLAGSPFVDPIREVVRGAGLLLWAVATWLLPGLFAMGWWRHVTHRIPLVYDANLWSIVFPLGMYAVCTHELAGVEGLPWLGSIASAWIWVAATAWLLTGGAMVRHVLQDVLLGERAG
ncbi:MAG TPA: tellurite resistance/C4-dicarboxylate transporter family protein [Marmoricola sp.]|nr:tellurite resistance/C4-dicarboxylate transporter family protein [Marmoricola sp.]